VAGTVPYLSYSDAAGAIGWLEAVGFETVTRHDGERGRVVHSELKLGDAVVMLASMDADYTLPPLVGRSTGTGLYLHVEDVRAAYDTAIAVGGSSVFEPEQTEWGTERARVLDPEGREWSFGSYEPGAGW
jgi:uncharacterized glyoxalase superfamily protein PhnB